MDAVLLVHRHLEIFEIIVHVFALELSLQHAMAQQIIVAHSVSRDRFQPREEVVALLVPLRVCGERILSELRIVTVIPPGSGELGKILQLPPIKFVEQRILFTHTIRDRRCLPESHDHRSENQPDKNTNSFHTWTR